MKNMFAILKNFNLLSTGRTASVHQTLKLFLNYVEASFKYFKKCSFFINVLF